MSSDALRVLAIGCKEIDEVPENPDHTEAGKRPYLYGTGGYD